MKAEPMAAAGAGLPATTGRGRPRSAAADSSIVETVLRLLEEGTTLGELSMERIARSAGVGKATVYRRWANKDALLIDVMRAIDEPLPPLAGTSVREDLVVLLEVIRHRGLAKRSSAVMRNVIGVIQSSPQLWRQYHDTVIRTRREAMYAVLRRGMRTGEIRDDIDVRLLVDLFAGPMLSRALLYERAPLEDGLSEQIVDAVLEGVRPSGHPASRRP